MKNTCENTNKEIFKYYGKEYNLVDEIVKGGCQGCAFINRLDCYKTNRTEICTKQHKIFKLYLKDIDK